MRRNLQIRGTRPQTRGFSLVELLVVIGIISLLIGIAMPAFSAAKIAAKNAATSATINTIGTGIEQFRADMRLGGSYPPSTFFMDKASFTTLRSPHLEDESCEVGGASLVAWALAGADLRGTPGFRDVNGQDPSANVGGYAPWADDTFAGSVTACTGLSGLYVFDANNQPCHARSAFVDVSKMKFPKNMSTGKDAYFEIPSAVGTKPEDRSIQSICFLDSFDQPILYYRANPGRPLMWGYQTPAQTNSAPASAGVYNAMDNVNLVDPDKPSGMDLGAGTGHFAKGLGVTTPGSGDRGTFAHTIWNPAVSAIPTPHNPETYILLSAGPDALFGTQDDIANFPVNK